MKVRYCFISNSSSSSFLIVGQSFESSDEAEEFSEKFGKKGDVGYMYDTYAAGIDVDMGIADGGSQNAKTFLKELQDAIAKCEELGIKEPEIIGYCSYDG
jgi:hypothetical protein